MRTNRYSLVVAAALALPITGWSEDGDKPQLPNPVKPASTLAGEEQPAGTSPGRGEAINVEKAEVDRQIKGWPERPRLGALMMIAKYGAPQQATSEKLVWENQGPYKRITVTKEEHAHDFPKPHSDFLEHTIAYKVPATKADELSRFDGSLTFDRTRGEMSARCDLEGHNILTLNLGHDIIAGKKDAEEARKAFSDIVMEDMLGKKPAYTVKLQFQPPDEPSTFADKPTIPGSSKRAMASKRDGSKEAKADEAATGDAEALGFLVAVNDNEIVAAMVAAEKKTSPGVAAYAKMLHTEHGKNMQATLKLGQKIDITPIETEAVDQLRVKGAGELAQLVPLDGEEFSKAFVAAMVKGHTEVLEMIDGKLLKSAENEALQKHLTMTREHIAAHLEEAKRLQAGTSAHPVATGRDSAPGERPANGAIPPAAGLSTSPSALPGASGDTSTPPAPAPAPVAQPEEKRQ